MSEGHFNQGEAYYRAGEWSKARTEFQASYEISRLDLLLFNIAQTYIKEGDSVRAIAALKAYLKTTPSDADAQAKLASLEAAAATERASPAQPNTSTAHPNTGTIGQPNATPHKEAAVPTAGDPFGDVSIHAPPNRKERPADIDRAFGSRWFQSTPLPTGRSDGSATL